MARSPKEKPRAFAPGPSWLAAMGFQRRAAGRVLELKVENPKSNRAGAREAQGDVASEFRGEGLDFLFLFCSSGASLFGGDQLVGGAHDCRETTRSDQALESAQEARRSGRGRTPHPDPRMLFGEGSVGEGSVGEGDGEASGVMSVA